MTNLTNGTKGTSEQDRFSIEEAVIEAIRNRKGTKITKIDFCGLETAPAREFIICQGNSTSQVSSIADNIREEVREHHGIKPYNYDGYTNSEWIVIDYGDTLVHVFVPEARRRYNLEELWSDAVITEIPDID